MAKFKEGDRVRVTATGATGTVDDPSYMYNGVLIMPDEPERPWAPLTPYLPFELELITEDGGNTGQASPADRATRECRHHGTVPDDHFPCRAPDENATQFTNRLLGVWRDV